MPSEFFEFQVPTRIVFGHGSLKDRLPGEMERSGAGRAFVCMDPGLSGTEVLGNLAALLKPWDPVFFTEVTADPTFESAQAAFDMYSMRGCDTVIAIGGGSALDTAKAVALQATNKRPLRSMVGRNCLESSPAPLIMVPTTAGTGSEVTGVTVLTDLELNAKQIIADTRLVPHVAILDPALLRTLPRSAAAMSSIDALSHALESYVSRFSNPYTESLAIKSIELIGFCIRRFVQDRTDTDAAGAMLMASNLAGISFSMARLGACHALGHPLGARLKVPHGLSIAMTLPVTVRFNDPARPEKYALAAGLLEDVQMKEPNNRRPCWMVIQQLIEDLGISSTLSAGKLSQSDLDAIAKDAYSQGLAAANPRDVSLQDFQSMIQQISSGK